MWDCSRNTYPIIVVKLTIKFNLKPYPKFISNSKSHGFRALKVDQMS